MNRNTIRQLYRNTCGVCWVEADIGATMVEQGANYKWEYTKDSGVHYVGTGFAVHSKLVVTAGHIVRWLRKHAIPQENIYCVFAGFPADVQGSTRERMPLEIRRTRAVYAFDGRTSAGDVLQKLTHPRVDFALLETNDAIMQFEQLPFASSTTVWIGDPISMAGYPYGNRGIFQDKFGVPRIGPLLTFGHVAAVHQFTNEVGACEIVDFLIDATTAQGMSGAAVCNQDGGIIGMITAGFEGQIEHQKESESTGSEVNVASTEQSSNAEVGGTTGNLPLNIARAVPMDRQLWERFLSAIIPVVGTP
jgi:V8-like Glu-specific endopeptidase